MRDERGVSDERENAEVTICMGSSCFARGNDRVLVRVRERLDELHRTEPGLAARAQLAGSRCEGHCKHGPVVRLDSQLHTSVTPDQAVALIDERLRAERR